MNAKEIFEGVLRQIGDLDVAVRRKAHSRLERLTMPYWALGRILDLAEQLCAIRGEIPPPVSRRSIVIFAADHGVAAEGVSLYPQEVTGQMVANFVAGGAGANALSKVGGAALHIVDVGVCSDISTLVRPGGVRDRKISRGTANLAHSPAMTEDEVFQALVAGIEMAKELAEDNDILAAGEMGIANTTAATAVFCALTGADPLVVTGSGTGLDAAGQLRKAEVVRKALELHAPDPADPFQILRCVGGLEIAAITGFYLAAAACRRPVVVDGFICTSAALLAQALAPKVVSFMVAAHQSAETGHVRMLETLGLRPLLDLGFRLGEGTGAAMAMPLFDAARAMLTDVATFEEAAVSDKTTAGKN